MADLFSVNDLLAMGGQGGGLGAGWPYGADQAAAPSLAISPPADQTAIGMDQGAPPAPAQAGLGGGAWPTSSLISAGLGMLGGGWLGGAQGYARGAALDQAAAQQAATERYRQQELAFRRQALGQQYEIAMKPQISFHIDPNTDEIRAFSVNPRSGSVQEISINNADKLSQAGVPAQVFNPFSEQYEDCPPGIKCKDLRKRYSDEYANVKMGKESAPQALARDSYQVVKDANANLTKDETDLQAFKPNTSLAEGVAGTGRLGRGIATKFSDPATTRFIEQKNAFMSEYAKWKRLNADQAQRMEPYFFGDPNGNAADAPIYRDRRAQVQEALRQAQGAAARVQAPRVGITEEEYRRLPSGSTYVDPHGIERTKR